MQTAEKYTKILLLLSLTTEDELLSKNILSDLVWTRASVFDFWSISFATVETTETLSGKLE